MHVMVDIETLATSVDAVIVQVGAYSFDIHGNDYGYNKELLLNVFIDDQVKYYKRNIDSNTVSWWMDNTTPEARLSVFNRDNCVELSEALQVLNDFILGAKTGGLARKYEFGVWANSPTFDLSIIRHAMGQLDIKPCWSYGEEYDVRTLRFLNTELELGVMYNKGGLGVAHNALDDSIGQSEFTKSVVGVLNTERGSPTKSL